MTKGSLFNFIFWFVLSALFLYFTSNPIYFGKVSLPPIGTLAEPIDGFYKTARNATLPNSLTTELNGLEGGVTVQRDERGVPHIFAQNDSDALRALGYVVAQDRLFEIDFLSRVAAGKLSEIIGARMLETDKFLRSTGMARGAKKSLAWYHENDPEMVRLFESFASGVNQYIKTLDESDLPFEMRLLHYQPEPYTFEKWLLIMQYMHYDLSWRSDDVLYSSIKNKLSPAAYDSLFPQQSKYYVPIIPETKGFVEKSDVRPAFGDSSLAQEIQAKEWESHQQLIANSIWEGFQEGKGSNNWVVSGKRSTTGKPILAGDPHLKLSLPSIWYEMHLVTPTMNTYGVGIPGTPMPILGFNENVAWSFTNTGDDQIDYYALKLNADSSQYFYNDAWRDIETVQDTIPVRGGGIEVLPLRFTHFGPIVNFSGKALAVQWTAHKVNRTCRAIWDMNHAEDLDTFQKALENFDGPMQNIIFADSKGHIAIRSTGYLPIRNTPNAGGILDGTSDAFDWSNRVPFDELPYSYNPTQGFLTSTNQQPVGPAYPYYQKHTWGNAYRSLRADTLLKSKELHSRENLMSYQGDITVSQLDFLKKAFSTLSDTEINALPTNVKELYDLLVTWNGATDKESIEPLVLSIFLEKINRLVWDEGIFQQIQPAEWIIWSLFEENETSNWFDIESTSNLETGKEILLLSLEATSDSLKQISPNKEDWRWGNHHKLTITHYLNNPALQRLGRGDFEVSGFDNTLFPAKGKTVTHSASWRMVVDFEKGRPEGFGIYPGGQSGNPFNENYDRFISSYLAFEYYPLLTPSTDQSLHTHQISSTIFFQ